MVIEKLGRLISKSYMLGFRNLVAHQWTGSYLMKQYGHHYRTALRLLSKAKNKTCSDWTGIHVWDSPVVALAPPLDPLKYGTPRRVITGAIGANGKS